jgi:tetratricopeptide (TPR) repeat protein
MLRHHITSLVCALLLAVPAVAQNEGQEDLDQATQLKVTAESLDDLNNVIDRLDTAIEKGLDKENAEFASQLLVSSLVQRGTLFSSAVFNVPAQDPQRGLRAMQLRQFALSDLQRAVGLDSKLYEAYLQIGKLQALPLGDPNAARRALSQVVDAAEAPPEQKAEALALRSALQKEDTGQLEDMNRAVELQPKKPDYLRLRAQYQLSKEKYTEALADVDAALKLEPEDAGTIELRGMALLGLQKYDDALKSFDRASELAPEAALPYQHRGQLYHQKGDLQKSLEQLTKAIELAPDNVSTLLIRASVYYQLKQPEKALEDIDKVIKLQPQLAQPHLMRAEILASTNRIDQAIAQLERLLQLAPGNEELLSRLGNFYLVAGRPRKAIEATTQIIAHDPKSFAALRLRADAHLGIGEHSEAIADFEKALEIDDSDEGLLNNFAWVLATSPDDKLRDGARAVKLATKASELTGNQTPHVLSTLAAAHAESGDFKSAIEWSQKAVDFAQKAVESAKPEDDRAKLQSDYEQLKKELTSYQEGKPTRERQTSNDAADTPPTADRSSAPTAAPAPARTADF